MALYDFHMHTFFSDGELLPTELVRRAIVKGYSALAITDHASASNMEELLEKVRRDADLIWREWQFRVLAGVELTHCPPQSIARLAAQARGYGAQMIVVHGETLVEPVPPGTNRASVECPDVDILAHPGLLTLKEAEIARETGVLLEVTSRRGHCLGNGNTVIQARSAGAKLIQNSDTHSPSDILTAEFARTVALGAGLTEDEATDALVTNPETLMERALRRSR